MDKDFEKKVKMKRIRAAAVALVVIAAIVYLILDMDVEKADYGDSLRDEIAKAEELYEAQRDNTGNEEGMYAPYTLLSFKSQIDDAKKVLDDEQSEYNTEKDAYEALKEAEKVFKKAENKDVISKTEAEKLSEKGETAEYTVDFKEGQKLEYSISGKELKEPEAINLMAKEEGPYHEEINEILSELSLQGQVVSFYQDGSFGGKIQVKAPMYSEKKVKAYAYKVNLKKGTLAYVSDGAVDTKAQTVSFNVSEGGDYVVVTKKMHKDGKKKVVKIKEEEKKAGKGGDSSEKTGGKNDNTGDNSGSSGGSSGQTPAVTTEKNIDVTIEIRCDTLANDLSKLENPALEAYVPADGTILQTTKVTVKEGSTVFDVLNKVCRNKGIQVESSYTPAYGSYYVEGINYLYEFDGGNLSGWMYKVNGWFPNYGCSSYTLKDGDKIVWVYTCDLGNDVGGGMS